MPYNATFFTVFYIIHYRLKLHMGPHFTTDFTITARCRWRSWLRHCAISRKVAGSIPDGVIGFFH
jgi:hypothetical protein